MHVQSIHASVAPQILNKVTRLFNGTAHDILTELLQNARRAGATKVDIFAKIGRSGEAMIVVDDDGGGIDDPQKLLSLGESGWNDALAAREDPAGMGVFSLAGRRVRVTSRGTASLGWSADIAGTAWASGAEIPVESCVRKRGTTVAVEVPDEWLEGIARVVNRVAVHYPLAVTLNGESIEQSEFLADAVLRADHAGLQIGIFEDVHHWPKTAATINFHGVTVPLELPVVKEHGSSKTWYARIDVIACPALQLTLPARKEVVETPFLKDLAIAVERLIFMAIATRSGHRLAFSDWQRATELGVTLPEAMVGLAPFVASTMEAGLSNDYGNAPLTRLDMVRIDRLETAYEQSLDRALDLNESLFAGLLVRSEPAFAGYRWYDDLACIDDLRFIVQQNGTIHIDDENGDVFNLEVPQVDAISVELTVIRNGISGVHDLPSDLLLQPDDNYDLDGASIMVVRGFLGTDAPLTPAILAHYLDCAYFCASDDRECDSFDTQLRYWQTQSINIAISLLQGAETATVASIEAAFLDHIRWLVPTDRVLRLEHGPSGTTIVLEPATAADTAAPPV